MPGAEESGAVGFGVDLLGGFPIDGVDVGGLSCEFFHNELGDGADVGGELAAQFFEGQAFETAS